MDYCKVEKEKGICKCDSGVDLYKNKHFIRSRPILTREDYAKGLVEEIIVKSFDRLAWSLTSEELIALRTALNKEFPIGVKSVIENVCKESAIIIRDLIDNVWKLSSCFAYVFRYVGVEHDYVSIYYLYEAMFSQPTRQFPIPQETCCVIFKVEKSFVNGTQAPAIIRYRVDLYQDFHDVRRKRLSRDTILAALKIKRKLFRFIENIDLF